MPEPAANTLRLVIVRLSVMPDTSQAVEVYVAVANGCEPVGNALMLVAVVQPEHVTVAVPSKKQQPQTA